MDFENISIGTDIEEISRFEGKTLENDKNFLDRIFTSKELEYCFSKSLPHFHLCARFCAKEAIIKALSDFKIKDVYYSDIEISNKEDGSPAAYIPKHPEIGIKVSLSHAKTYANAVAIVNKD